MFHKRCKKSYSTASSSPPVVPRGRVEREAVTVEVRSAARATVINVLGHQYPADAKGRIRTCDRNYATVFDMAVNRLQ